MKIQRYDFFEDSCRGVVMEYGMREDDEGDYVKFEDVEKKLASKSPNKANAPCILIFENGKPVRLVDSMDKFRAHDGQGKRVTWASFDLE